MPKIKPGQSRKDKIKAQRESPSPFSSEAEEALISQNSASVIQSMNRNETVEEIPEQEVIEERRRQAGQIIDIPSYITICDYKGGTRNVSW